MNALDVVLMGIAAFSLVGALIWSKVITAKRRAALASHRFALQQQRHPKKDPLEATTMLVAHSEAKLDHFVRPYGTQGFERNARVRADFSELPRAFQQLEVPVVPISREEKRVVGVALANRLVKATEPSKKIQVSTFPHHLDVRAFNLDRPH